MAAFTKPTTTSFQWAQQQKIPGHSKQPQLQQASPWSQLPKQQGATSWPQVKTQPACWPSNFKKQQWPQQQAPPTAQPFKWSQQQGRQQQAAPTAQPFKWPQQQGRQQQAAPTAQPFKWPQQQGRQQQAAPTAQPFKWPQQGQQQQAAPTAQHSQRVDTNQAPLTNAFQFLVPPKLSQAAATQPSLQAAVRVNSGPAHEGVSCDMCKVGPIRGARFKCLCCANFDVCEACCHGLQSQQKQLPQPIASSASDPAQCRHDVLVMVREPRWHQTSEALANKAGWAHPGIACAGCGDGLPIQGRRYTCTVCEGGPSFCERCDFCGVHAAAGLVGHPMLRVCSTVQPPPPLQATSPPVTPPQAAAAAALCFCCGLPQDVAAAQGHRTK
eukprot:COSAG01_NODE_4777_length_4750_cov_16.589121_2_plen_383_part_00